jgi:hypothetical protein
MDRETAERTISDALMRKRLRARHYCSNDVDPITLEPITNIAKERLVKVTDDGVVHCFDVGSMHDYYQRSGELVNPITRSVFSERARARFFAVAESNGLVDTSADRAKQEAERRAAEQQVRDANAARRRADQEREDLKIARQVALIEQQRAAAVQRAAVAQHRIEPRTQHRMEPRIQHRIEPRIQHEIVPRAQHHIDPPASASAPYGNQMLRMQQQQQQKQPAVLIVERPRAPVPLRAAIAAAAQGAEMPTSAEMPSSTEPPNSAATAAPRVGNTVFAVSILAALVLAIGAYYMYRRHQTQSAA